MDKNLHIITFDIPYPPDYGGVTDLLYKIRSLSSAAISPGDQTYFSTINKTVWIPPFHQWQTLPTIENQSDYILFHGNLSVNENIRAVGYLIKYVFSRISLPVIIAGKNPEHKVYAEAKSIKNIRVIANPSGEEMNWLISKAMINILITFQPTGFKLNLINAIFGGGHTIVNKIMIENSRMEKLCNIADTPEEIISTINRLQSINFNDCKEIISERKKALNSMFSNKNNAQKIENLIWGDPYLKE